MPQHFMTPSIVACSGVKDELAAWVVPSDLSYQPPLFSTQELEASVPSALVLVRHCHHVWRKAHTTLLSPPSVMPGGPTTSVTHFPLIASDSERGSPLSTFPGSWPAESLPPWSVGPFPISKLLNPVAVQTLVPCMCGLILPGLCLLCTV